MVGKGGGAGKWFMNDATALEVRDLGLIPYAEALALQSDLVERRRAGVHRSDDQAHSGSRRSSLNLRRCVNRPVAFEGAPWHSCCTLPAHVRTPQCCPSCGEAA